MNYTVREGLWMIFRGFSSIDGSLRGETFFDQGFLLSSLVTCDKKVVK